MNKTNISSISSLNKTKFDKEKVEDIILKINDIIFEIINMVTLNSKSGEASNII